MLRETAGLALAVELMATGGTLQACATLLKSIGAEVAGATVLIELVALHGRDALKGIEIRAPIKH